MGDRTRLTRPHQFETVYGRGRSLASGPVVVKALPNGLDYSRYGFSVSRRVGGAVVRNLVKRRLREIMRRMPLRTGWDLVIVARSSAANMAFHELAAAIRQLLGRAHVLDVAVCPEEPGR